MYIDGHEREDVVKDRKEFVDRFVNQYAPRMSIWDNDGNETPPRHDPTLNLQGQVYKVILVTHDESTFYANDRQKTRWVHESQKATPERKGEGPSIMLSDFLTSEWGRLRSRDGTE